MKGKLNRILSAVLALCMIVSVAPNLTFTANAAATDIYYDFLKGFDSANMANVETITYDHTTVGGAKEMNVGTNSAPWAYEDSTVTSNGNGTTKIQYAAAGYGFYFMTAWREHSAELKIKIKVDNAGKYIPMVNIHGRGNYDRPVPLTASLLNGSTELASKHINTAAYGSMNHYVALCDTPIQLSAGEYTAKFNVDTVCGYAIVDGFKLVAADSAVATNVTLGSNDGLYEVNMGDTVSVPVNVTMSDGSKADLSKLSFQFNYKDIASAQVDGNNIVITPVAVGQTEITVKHGSAMTRAYIKVNAEGTTKTPGNLYYNFNKVRPDKVHSTGNPYYTSLITYNLSTVGAYGEVKAFNGTESATSVYSDPWMVDTINLTEGNLLIKFKDYGFAMNGKGYVDFKFKVPFDGYYTPAINVYSNTGYATHPGAAAYKVLSADGKTEYSSKEIPGSGTGINNGKQKVSTSMIRLTKGEYIFRIHKTGHGDNIYDGFYMDYSAEGGELEPTVTLSANAFSAFAGAAASKASIKLDKDGVEVPLSDEKVTAVSATSASTAIATASASKAGVMITPVAEGTTTVTVTVTYNGKNYTATIPVSVVKSNAKTMYEYDFQKLVQWSTVFADITTITDFALTTMGDPKEIYPKTTYADYTDPFIYVGQGGGANFRMVDSQYAAMLDGPVGAWAIMKIRIGAPGTYAFKKHCGLWEGGAMGDIFFAPDGATDIISDKYYIGTVDTYSVDRKWHEYVHVANVTVPTAGDYYVGWRMAGKNDSATNMRLTVSGINLEPTTAGELKIYNGDYDRVIKNETINVDLSAKIDNVAADFVNATAITATVADADIASAKINRSSDNKSASVEIGGIKAGKTKVTVSATVNGSTSTITLPVVVVEKKTKAEEIVLDFTKNQDKPITDKKLSDNGWRLNKSMTNSAISNPSKFADFSFQDYGINANYQGNNNTELKSDITLDFDVLAASAYELRVQGGNFQNGAKVAVYVDKKYVGEYDFYAGADNAEGVTLQMNTVDLSQGIHTITFRRVNSDSGKDTLALRTVTLKPVSKMPTFKGFDLELNQHVFTIGEKATIKLGPSASDGSPCNFGKLFAGNADDPDSFYTYTNSDPTIVSIKNGVITALKAGETTITVKGKKGDVTADKNVKITVQNDPLASVTADIKAAINNGEAYTVPVKALTANGREINPMSYTPVLTATPDKVVAIRDNTITGIGQGETEVTVSVTINGVTKTAKGTVAIANGGIKLYAYADRTILKPTDEATQLRVADSVLNEIMPNRIKYSSENEAVVKVDANGKVTPVGLGKAYIYATTTYNGTEYNLSVLFKITEGKSESSYYTKEKVAALRDNLKKYDWASSDSADVIKKADDLIDKLGNDYWNLITTQELPRSASMGYRWDPKAAYCKYCGLDLANSGWGTYGWLMDPINKPWKVTCPDCRKTFPTNDFGKFYELGIDEHGNWDYELAKAENAKLVAAGQPGYLVNELLPEKGAGWGVDDGYGYRTGTMITNAKGQQQEEVHVYIPYYNHWGVWYGGSYGGSPYCGLMYTAIDTLHNAYLNTGNRKYGEVGAILIDRIADVYPDMFTGTTFPLFAHSDSTQPKGKIVGCIWQHGMNRVFVRSYDAFYDMYDDPKVIEKIAAKAQEYDLGAAKTSAVEIRERIEERLVLQSYKDIRAGEIHGNFGMHQSLAAYVGVVYDTMPKTKEIIDWIFESTTNTFGDNDISGGNVLAQLINLVDRDGFGAESAPGYNVLWLGNITTTADVLAGYKTYAAADLYKNPRFIKMFKAYLPLTLIRNQTAQIGDSGATGMKSIAISDGALLSGFIYSGDPALAQFIYHKKNGNLLGIHADKWTKDPEAVQQQIIDTVKKYGEYDFDQSLQLTGYGFSILRDGTYKKAANAADTVNTQRDMWIYYGGANSHNHGDHLNLGMEAFGVNIMPDLGYPTAADGSDKTYYWETGTVSHNTVMVNDSKQNRMYSYLNGTARQNGRPLHFDDSGRVKVMDVLGNYQAVRNEIFRRSVVMVQVDGENSYGVDFFRVKGGSNHSYNFHAMSNTITETEGLTMTAQSGGTYAGPDVPHEKTGYTNGYSYLYNVRKSPSSTGNFAVDFQIQDFRSEGWGKDNIHLRVSMLNNFALEHVAFAKGNPPNRDGNPDTLEFVLARRNGTNLDSLFTAVYEPYKGERYIAKIEAADVSRIGGAERGANDVAKAVKVTRKDGTVDYIVYNTNNKMLVKVDGKYEFMGFVGVFTEKDGELVYAYGNDASKVDTTSSTDAYTGTIVDFTKDLAAQNYITVQFDSAIDVNKIIGQYTDITNGRTENAAYKILAAEDLGNNKYKLDIGEASTIASTKTLVSLSDGYMYNLAAGNTFRIPLPTIVGTQLKFNGIKDQFAEAGAEVKLNLAATGGEGKELKYSLVTGPTGASIDELTGQFLWLPQNSHRGDNVIGVQVTDGVLTETAYFTITVFGYTNPTPRPNPQPAPGGGGGGESKLTVTFNTNGGSNVASQSIAKGALATQPADPTKEGFTFDGWYTDAELTTKYDFTTPVNAKITLYAKWVEGEATAKRFTDLGNHKWAEDAIYRLVEAGVVNGTSATTYAPGVKITRADFTTLIVRAFKFEAEVATFKDVDPSKYYATPVGIAKTLGIVGGVNANDFAPTAPITRQDMMVIIYRALNAAGIEIEKTTDVSFTDMGSVAAYAKDAVEALTGAGLIAGSNGKINPKNNTTRAEVAVVLDRILNK